MYCDGRWFCSILHIISLLISPFPYRDRLLEFHNKNGITFRDILDNISPGKLACREWKYPPRPSSLQIIFRTIFFTWPSDCIKKIAYLLCGSVLAWKLATQGPWNYKARIQERMVAINVSAEYSVTHGSFWLCLIFRGTLKSQHVRRKWSYIM